MDYVLIIGSAAAFCTTVSFLPQVVKTHKEKQTKDLSLAMLILFVAGLSLWTTYGILLGQIPIIAANSITLVLVIYVLTMKLKYG